MTKTTHQVRLYPLPLTMLLEVKRKSCWPIMLLSWIAKISRVSILAKWAAQPKEETLYWELSSPVKKAMKGSNTFGGPFKEFVYVLDELADDWCVAIGYPHFNNKQLAQLEKITNQKLSGYQPAQYAIGKLNGAELKAKGGIIFIPRKRGKEALVVRYQMLTNAVSRFGFPDVPSPDEIV